jgi:hypothetical protein
MAKSYAQWFNEATAQAARDAFRLFAETGCAQHWLYFKPNGLEFRIAQEKPDGFELVTGEAVPSSLEHAGLTAWVRRYAATVPVLPKEYD